MSRILWAFIGVCFVTVGVGAQAYPSGQGQDPTSPTTQAPAPQAPTTRPTTPAPASAAAAAKKVTYSGCIERQPASAAAVTGGANMPFTLAKASEVGANSAVATSGTATEAKGTATGAASATKSYRLDGAEATLAPHVGHKVEITGTLDDQPTSASAGANARGANATGANATGANATGANATGANAGANAGGANAGGANAGGANASGANATGSSAAAMGRLKVDSVKMVSTSCS